MHFTLKRHKRRKVLNIRGEGERRGGVIVVVALLFYVHGKHLRSCRDGQFA